MELKQLQTFRAVATELSFTRAAEVLAYAQSSVTAQIQGLEQQFGVPLFNRLGKRVAITEEGKRLLFYAERMLQLADEAQLAVRGDDEPSGTLRIGAPESLFTYRLPPILREFRSRCPKVELHFKPDFYPGHLGLRREVMQGTVDVALFFNYPRLSDTLIVEQLLQETLLLIAEPDHPLTRLETVLPGKLEGEVILLTEAGCTYRELFEQILRGANVHPATKLEFASVEAIKQCVMAGMGIGFLPEIAVRAEISSGRMTALRWSGEELSVVTHLAWHKDKWISPALRVFLELVKQLSAFEHQ
ncbi:LysR family transcriptional regulator [Paenibacillus sedimenti]|uniref:LysR family transcriptional regulator n=1 Tax=Paenibacillus sedimenti TaxID=2770274 RepID=A0A926QJU5_9BACL|nr:LysR family transcriptional regulator [Paenibacillus sedimenti]MBD0380829.1 LysR family transcriptional regulator [Paenibacillus sedimenti]